MPRKSQTAFCFLGHYPKRILAGRSLVLFIPSAAVNTWFVGGEGVRSWKLFHGQDGECALGKTMLAVPNHLLLRALGSGFQQHMPCHLVQELRLGCLDVVPWIILLDGGHGICLSQSSGATIKHQDIVEDTGTWEV